MTIAVDLGSKATKQTNKQNGTQCVHEAFFLLSTLSKLYSFVPHFVIQSAKWIVSGHHLTLYLIETPFNTFANRADPDQAALVRAA